MVCGGIDFGRIDRVSRVKVQRKGPDCGAPPSSLRNGLWRIKTPDKKISKKPGQDFFLDSDHQT